MAPFTVLHVCTGNIARSAMAECTMREVLRGACVDDLCHVTSAGTWGHEGSRMEPFAREVLAAHDIDATAFIAHGLDVSDVKAADLVLTAEREHRAAVVHLDPSALRRAFTLKEFARLVDDAPALPASKPTSADEAGPRWREVVAAVATRRGVDGPGSAADDLADPYGAPLTVYQARFAEIRQAVERVVGALVAAL